MGEIEKKRFKEPSYYYKYFIFFVIIIAACTWFLIFYGFFQTEQDIYERWAYRKLTGTSRMRSEQSLVSFFAREFGKTGFMFLFITCKLAIICYFIEIIAEYRRYKKKCRLFHEGLIENIYDIYDDHVPLLSWRRIKMLFAKKEKPLKNKLPTKRTMKKHIKQSEKYFKQKK